MPKNGNEYDEDLEMKIYPVIQTRKLGKHARSQKVFNNILSPIVQRMKKAAKQKQNGRQHGEKGLVEW